MFKEILLGFIFLLILAIVVLVVFVQLNWDKVYEIPYPDLKVSTDSTVLTL